MLAMETATNWDERTETLTDEARRPRHAARTHLGLRRRKNEDAFYASSTNLFVVCDGLGAHGNGDRAAQMAVGTIVARMLADDWLQRPDAEPAAVERALQAAVSEAHHAILVETDRLELSKPMSTTVVAAIVLRSSVVVVSVGDSRAYLVRGAELRRLTTDHTVVEQMVLNGVVAPEEATTHPLRHVLLRALGNVDGDRADVSTVRLETGDRLLLCSDGLTSMVDEATIRHRLRSGGSLESTSSGLVAAALAAGGRDNVTLVLLDPAA